MTTLQTVFAKAKADDRAALVGYLPAGFPTKDGAIAAATAMVEAGCDVIEIGLPYSDPLMDGPTIQDAVHRALSNGTRIADVLRTVEGVAKTGAATLVMTYWNPIDRYGAERFARDLASAGGVGTITPDLTPEEAGPWREASAAAGIDTVFLVAPSSTDARIKAVVECCTGFVYAASLMGVTGARESVSSSAQGLVERTRAHTDLPVCVGLGVGNGRQAAEVAAYADGVIVGSAFIRRLLDAADETSGLAAVRELGAELAAGVRA
ncbi:tryptophan synthase subunit alpha [Planomonospora parontospora]|uniref:tryptophan synthase subunit alpha n=1 Tax=Planomonospora parontospora TaxID=58119 RepID=UPI00167153BA|nr:tryptophan synthase subunit alpha [Planomonospora parontospora]GGL19923.1 tryptophan synthase alpha chain [Planomonospora parontospora subsp. antibiotica]GII13663.1 tryptophan synthase alpha chain [Planomonospora parontospora subsp. antibiotica]